MHANDAGGIGRAGDWPHAGRCAVTESQSNVNWRSVDIHRFWPFDHRPMQRLKVRSKIDSLPLGCSPTKMTLPAW